jgi:hypothetical protein
MSRRAPRGQQLPLIVVCRGVAGLAAAAVLAACSSTPAQVALPGKSRVPSAATDPAGPATSASAHALAAGSPQQHSAASAYLAFWSAASRAESAGNSARARALLAPYADPQYIATMISGMRSEWSNHEVPSGAAVEHIESVQVALLKQGQYVAVVRDCRDSSHQDFRNATTGAPVAGTRGGPHQEFYTTLGLIGGHWLVEQVTYLGDTCTS